MADSKEGYLEKRGEWNKAFKRRFFVLSLKGKRLSYAKTPEDYRTNNVQGRIDMGHASIKDLPRESKDFTDDNRAFQIWTPRRVYIVKAETGAEAKLWKDALKEATSEGANRRQPDDPNQQPLAQHGFDANAAEATEEELLTQLKFNQDTAGATHPNTAVCLHNLAYFYSKHGQLQKSEQLYTQALKYLIDALGAEHQEVAVCTGNYAVCLKRQGRYDEALQTFRRALDLAERTWGPNDEKTSDILYNIYANFYAQGKFVEARPYLVRSLEINRAGLGPNHPEVQQSEADLKDLDARVAQSRGS
jgi:tetratricopeptide (TPR) repeat protein